MHVSKAEIYCLKKARHTLFRIVYAFIFEGHIFSCFCPWLRRYGLTHSKERKRKKENTKKGREKESTRMAKYLFSAGIMHKICREIKSLVTGNSKIAVHFNTGNK